MIELVKDRDSNLVKPLKAQFYLIFYPSFFFSTSDHGIA